MSRTLTQAGPMGPVAVRPLSALSNRELIAGLKELVATERRHQVAILRHLGEIERRRIHLEMGCSSLFEYCVSGLRYSRSAAGRRIACARVLRRVPEAGDMLVSGEVSLTTLSMIARVMTPANGPILLKRIRGKSQRQVEGMVSAYRPESTTRDRVRAVVVRERVPAVAESTPGAGSNVSNPGSSGGGDDQSATAQPGINGNLEEGGAWKEKGNRSDAGNVRAEPAARAGNGSVEPLGLDTPPPTRAVHKHEIRFVAGPEFMRAVERMRVLMSHSKPDATFEDIFAAAMEAYIDRNCPVRRNTRRAERNARSTTTESAGEPAGQEAPRYRLCTGTRRSLPGAGSGSGDRGREDAGSRGDADQRGRVRVPGATTRSRVIPRAVRDAVFARDGGRCTYVGPDGNRCNAREQLECDHVRPFALGGGHTTANLRLLCRAHNHHRAERTFGPGPARHRRLRE